MKKILIVVFLLAAASLFIAKSSEIKEELFGGGEPDTSSVLVPKDIQSDEEQLISTIISRYHYRKVKMDDSISSVIFDRYLNTLDNNRSYFLASDMKKFEAYRHSFDDDFKDGNLDPAYEIFNMFKDRFNERIEYSSKLLENEMDFTKDEDFQIDREDEPFPVTTEEANDLWRKRVKNDALNLKLTGKDWEGIKETLTKRYQNLQKNINQYTSEDVFQLIMNSYTEAIDPHTNYLSPITSENFKINMSLSLEGIGAQLQNEDDYTKIAEVVPGGPAYKSKKLHQNDRIVGVAQGDDGEMVDVVGWRVTEVVQLIRGPKGTVVRLAILRATDGPNAQPVVVRLVRDKIKLEEQAAKKDILEIKNDGKAYRVGVITIPAFYFDYEAQQRGDKDYKSTTKDVRLLIDSLRQEKVDGIVIDLRNNGGGALSEAISLTGLFIEDGPVVQVKNTDGKIDVGDDPDPAIVYNGPLAVLVNKFSASASEIFAGAIQDYGRGLVLGDQTYGKGTVQNLIDLNRLMKFEEDKLGQVKVTIAKYYRINGGSTQNLGVVPDIKFPSYYDDPEHFGESSEPSALPWDQIQPTDYKLSGDLKPLVPDLEKRHKERIKKDPEFDYLLEDIQEYKDEHDQKLVSLNEEKRKKEKDAEEEKKFQRENERRKVKGLKLLEKGETNSEPVKAEDPLLNESAYILSDLIKMTLG